MKKPRGSHTPLILLGAGCVLLVSVVLLIVFCLRSASITSEYAVYLRFALDAGAASDGVFVDTEEGPKQLSEESVRKIYYYLTASKVLSLTGGDVDDPDCIRLTMGDSDFVLIVPAGDRESESIVHLGVEGRHYMIRTKCYQQWDNLRRYTGADYQQEAPAAVPHTPAPDA